MAKRSKHIPESDERFIDFDTIATMLMERFQKEAEEARKNLYKKPMKDANKKTLVLKIQMKDVVKPPMWREVTVPADFSFTQLHYIIMAVTGLDNCHLWQFQRRAYDSEFEIGITRKGQFDMGLDSCSHNADETPLTAFLAKEKDSLEYVYDFRHDWIFKITVKAVTDRQGDEAQMTKWKSDLQASEDIYGNRHYAYMRNIIGEWPTMTDKQKEEITENQGFEDADDFEAWFEDNQIDPEFINEELADIPDEWQSVY